ncbi:MAG: tetratricopeptide repeat protein [Candidatus Kapaibacterium sp.]
MMQPVYMRSSIKSVLPAWVFCCILVAACAVLYTHTASYAYTDLDDTIFIREFEQFNRQDDSYMRSFRRGVFSDSGDTYYRPLLLASFVFDRHREGRLTAMLHGETSAGDSISTYHVTNIILHIGAVLLLFFLLRLLRCNNTVAFVIAVIFAVHPVLVQAVVWIPGRNDTLLAVFIFSFLLSAFAAVEKQRHVLYPVQFLCLLGALFTKETGIIAAPMALFILVVFHGMRLRDPRLRYLVASWVSALAAWLVVRSSATVLNQDIAAGALAGGFVERLPLIIQYLGKIVLPFNLAVVPYQDQTTMWYGVGALCLITAAVLWSRERQWRGLITGGVWFLVFLLPALIVPKSLNNEAYEHRLYVPMVGILFLLAQTDLTRRFNERRVLLAAVPLCAALFVASYMRTDLFSNRLVFWESAVASSPASPFTTMMLGSRYLLDKTNPRREDGERLLRSSFAMDSNRKYINYYMALLLWDRDRIRESEPYLEKELTYNPQWAELYFRLARCAIERGDLAKGKRMLERNYALNPMDEQGANNLLMVCCDIGRFDEAKSYADRIQASGIPVPRGLLERIAAGNIAPTPAR